MGKIEIAIPAMGEGITEAIVNKFLKNIGEPVEENELIAEIATDKVDSEIVSPHKGIIEKLLVNEGDTAKVGQTIIIIEAADVSENSQQNMSDLEIKIPVPALSHTLTNLAPVKQSGSEVTEILHTSHTPLGKFLSPLVRSMAKAEGISLKELDEIVGTGAGNRLTKEDIQAYLFARQNTTVSATVSETGKSEKLETKLIDNNIEYIPMDRMRKLISEHMVKSKQTSAHVTSFIEVDVTNLVMWREKNKEEFQLKYNEKITFTPIFIECIVKAIKEYPLINVSVKDSNIILKKGIHIGMATALPGGNLIVPVIKDASELNLLGITKRVNDLANRARNNKLKPDEIQGGTFTLTNLGSFGSLTGTPIINQPEVAILAVGIIKKRPVVIENPQGDTIGIRHMMIMSMSYDHRVVDGALGGMFLKKVAELLEGFNLNREI